MLQLYILMKSRITQKKLILVQKEEAENSLETPQFLDIRQVDILHNYAFKAD